MSERKYHVTDIPVKGPDGVNNIRVEARYHAGGTNIWSYAPIARGYSVHVQPEALEDCDGIRFRRYTPMQGFKKHCQDAKAFNAKVFERFCASAMEQAQPLVDHLIKTYGLELLTTKEG